MAEPVAASALSLSVGDRVVYPNQGLCTVTDIKNEEIAGQKLVFVSLQVIETGARVKAPQEKLARIGIRRLSSGDEVKKVVDFLRADSEKASLDWKKRARDNTLRLSEGGLRGLAEVVKGLQVLSELRPLPPKERGQYDDARHLFVTEFAAATGLPECDAEDALDIILFPVGKERPKRTIEEFKALAGDGEDDLGLADDLLGLDPEAPAEDADADGGDASEGDGESDSDDAAPKKAAAKAPKEKPAKEKAGKAGGGMAALMAALSAPPAAAKATKAEKVAKAPKAAKPPKAPAAKKPAAAKAPKAKSAEAPKKPARAAKAKSKA